MANERKKWAFPRMRGKRSPVPESNAANSSSNSRKWRFFSKHQQTFAPSNPDQDADDIDCEGSDQPPARITLLYESRDGKLCLFEDGEGHLTAVRAEKLA